MEEYVDTTELITPVVKRNYQNTSLKQFSLLSRGQGGLNILLHNDLSNGRAGWYSPSKFK